MEPPDSPTQEQSATASPSPAPASAAPETSVSSGAETTTSPSPADQLAEVEADFRRLYDPQVEAEPADVEKTEEQAPAATEEKPTEVEPTPEAKAPEEEATTAPEQLRPRLHDPEDIAVASLAKARGIKLSEAAAIIAGTPAAKTTEIPGMKDDAGPSPVQQLEAQINALAEVIKAERADGDDYLTPAHLDRVDQLADLKGDLRQAKFEERQAAQAREQSQTQAAKTAHGSSIEAAKATYPTVADVTTPLGAEVGKVIAEWQKDKASLAFLEAPDAPEIVAAEAASRLAMSLFREGKFATAGEALASLKAAPAAAPKAPVPPSSPVPAARQTVAARRVTPAPGSQGQVQRDQPSTLTEATANVTTAKEGNELLRRVYGDMPLTL